MKFGISNFIELNEEEAFPKIIALIKSSTNSVKIWMKGEESHFYKSADVQKLSGSSDKSEILIKVFSEGEEEDQKIIGKHVYIGFSLNDVDYFSEGNVSVNETDGNLFIKLTGPVYRSENRANERLLTFPHHQVYAYFKIEKELEEGTNVIPLKKNEDEPEYLNYKQKQKEEMKKDLSKFVEDIDQLVGFRAMDISKSGIAFTVGHEEVPYFQDSRRYNFLVLFNGQVFKVKSAKMVYKVDFLSREKVGSKYKVGLHFNEVQPLTELVTQILRSSNAIDAVQKEFEEFVDK